MDYNTIIKHTYEQIEIGHIDKAVMGCLRIARNLKDYFYTAIFLREMYPNKKELMRIMHEDMGHLKVGTKKFIYEKSAEYWMDLHTIDFSLSTDNRGEKKNIFMIGIGELDPELKQLENTIQDMTVPSGLSECDIVALTDHYGALKAQIRLRIKALNTLKERIRTRCLNYVILIERQLYAQRKTQSFLEQAQNV